MLRGFSIERYRTKLVLIEDHILGLKLYRHLTGRGYRRVRRTRLNRWYAPREAQFPLGLFDRLFRKRYLAPRGGGNRTAAAGARSG